MAGIGVVVQPRVILNVLSASIVAFIISFCVAKYAFGGEFKCKLPPDHYGPLPLADCYQDKKGNIGCSYHICMEDPTGQKWCGSILLMQYGCNTPWEPTLIELLPKPTPEQQKVRDDREKQLTLERKL